MAWGRKRSSIIVKVDRPDMPFTGRWDAVDELIDHAITVTTASLARNALSFMHASPGMGKTRLLCELVAMNDALVNSQVDRLKDRNESLSAFKELLPVVVSFNEITRVNPNFDDRNIDLPLKDELFRFAIRLIHIWLINSNHDLERLTGRVITDIKEKTLPQDLVSLPSVLELIKSRSKKTPFLLVDEILYLKDDEKDLASTISKLSALQDKNGFPVAFTTLRVGVFSQAVTDSGRPIKPIPMRSLSVDDTSAVIEATTKDVFDEFIKESVGISGKSFLANAARLSSGHMRATESVIQAVKDLRDGTKFLIYIDHAANLFKLRIKGDDLLPAVVLSLLGKQVTTKAEVRTPICDGKVMIETVEGLVSRGALMSSFNNLDPTNRITPEMHLLVLFAWTKKEKGNNSKLEENKLKAALARSVYRLIYYATGDPMTGTKFEDVCIARKQMMRDLYKIIMDGNVIEASNVDWRNVSINDIYESNFLAGDMSDKLKRMRFDFTQPLDWNDRLYLTDSEVKKILHQSIVEKKSVAIKPGRQNFPDIDYFVTLVSLDGSVVVVAHQVKWSANMSSTKLNVTELDASLKKAISRTVDMGIFENVPSTGVWTNIVPTKNRIIMQMDDIVRSMVRRCPS